MSLVSRITEVVTAIGVAIKGKQDKSIIRELVSDINLVSTSLIDVPALSYTLKANTVYQLIAYLPFSASTSGAVCKIGYSAPAGAISMLEVLTPINNINLSVYDYYSYIYSSGEILSQASAGYTLLTNTQTNPCMVKGIIKTNSGGVFTLRVASEDGTSVTIKAGSTLILIPA